MRRVEPQFCLHHNLDVAFISFQPEAQVVKLLVERKNLLNANKPEQALEVELKVTKIADCIKTEFKRPKVAYVTFMTEIGLIKAIQHLKVKKDFPVKLTPGPGPHSLIYENLDLSLLSQAWRIAVYLIVLVLCQNFIANSIYIAQGLMLT
jgi:hypothetical protein